MEQQSINYKIETAINFLLIIFAFLLPFGKPILNLVMILLFLLWLIQGQWNSKFKILNSSLPFKLYFLFILILGFSMLWSESLDGAFTRHDANALEYYLRHYITGFIIIPIFLTSLKKEFFHYVFSGFLMGMFISEVMSWGIFFELIHYKNVNPMDPSPFLHHSFYSIFLSITVFVLLYQLTRPLNYYYKFAILIFILSAVGNLFLNGGRLGQLSFLVSLFVYIILYYKVNYKSISGALLVLLTVVTIAYSFSPVFKQRVNLSYQTMQQILHGDYRSSWGIRANMIRVSKDLVIENPLLGVGIGDAKSKFTEKVFCYDQQQYINYSNLHNGFLQILVETGFLGLIAFMLFLYYLAKNAKINQKIFLFSIAVIVNILVGFLGEPLLFRSSPYLLFNLMTAMIIYTLLEKAKSPSTPCCFQ